MLRLEEFEDKDIVIITDNENGVKIVKFICSMYNTGEVVSPIRYEELRHEMPLSDIVNISTGDTALLYEEARIYVTDMTIEEAEKKLSKLSKQYGEMLEIDRSTITEDIPYGHYIFSCFK